MKQLLHGAWVIARRDFAATVLSKAFVFFLLGPLFPLLLGGLFGSISARVTTQAERPVIAVLWSDADFNRLAQAHDQLAQAIAPSAVPTLVHYSREPDSAAQQQRLLATGTPPVRAVLSGDVDHPHLTGAVAGDPATLSQLRLLIANARVSQGTPEVLPVTNVVAPGAAVTDRAATALIGEVLIFFLTLFLAGMVMSQLIEEKSNKIIEVIAAAVPIDAMFIGKLFAMLAASVLGIIVWLASGALFVQMLKQGGIHTLPPPAIGWPFFLVLVVIYFAMNYLLIGAIMLTIGAQASTAREVQVLAMPATFGQLLVFGLATTAVGAPDSTRGIAAAIFPLSSPMAMLARAAQEPQWWPHLIAILWQALWVGLILRGAAQLFRRTVLKSGPRRPWWKLGSA
jgi:ABC-2 type transport system permease protein